jgi:hypothetical protein
VILSLYVELADPGISVGSRLETASCKNCFSQEAGIIEELPLAAINDTVSETVTKELIYNRIMSILAFLPDMD